MHDFRSVSYTHLDVYKRQTWRDVIAAVLETCKEPVALSFLYEQIKPHKKAQSNKWWKEKIRQTLQINPMHFTHDGRGLWSLNRNAA